MTREWKPSKPCMDCISYEYESSDEGRCVVAEFKTYKGMEP